MTVYLGQPLSESIAEHIGATPLVTLNRLPASLGIKAKVCAKLEYLNAGGSVKDRIARRMVEQAERDGLIKPGDTLIEASSGNTCIVTLSEKMSLEKEQILHDLGTQVVRTPTGVPIESPDSILSVARRFNQDIPNSYILDQYNNAENPLAHELGTAQEIWHQTQGKVDVVLAGAGTGGTVTSLARGLK
ncbi:PLP-dependent cysteine synthase family protein [Aspergillus affinis]|uniref:PLP-dependent cysteine synthase family protein n=1 Tax=Aspergillus affinis TaxID=1070780 RepID=UPI0022FE2BEC|nr:cystathionine beta-synthase [Aspergillus affinis]KAI9039786.1 cystathionine beta-synthase [Aspergillus affinis]